MKKLINTVLVVLCLLIIQISEIAAEKRPNVFVILLDDMGYNDVSFHGSDQYFTSNIDSLAFNGIILKNYYVPALCSPSRSSLMTGKYPTTIGMQHLVIEADEPWGLPLEEKIMPEYFKDAGYSTSIFGKWHLGFHKRSFLPNNRGFDRFFGYRGPYVDYWTHERYISSKNYSSGFDTWDEQRASYETIGNYSTILITDKAIEHVENYNSENPMFMYLSYGAPHAGNDDDPLQAPQEVIDRFSYIEDPKRRLYAAMMAVVDEQIGRFVTALDRKGLLNNSVILLYSDNGAASTGFLANSGSNYPLKGQKHSPWEGGIRSAGLIWSPHLKSISRVSGQLIHCSDWLPTLASLAGINIPVIANLDGMNMWQALSENLPSPRNEVVHNIDPIIPYTSYMYGDWKYVNGTVNPLYDTWLGEIPKNENPKSSNYVNDLLSSTTWNVVKKFRSTELAAEDILKLRKDSRIVCRKDMDIDPLNVCDPVKAPCLFNIKNDPCELDNQGNKLPRFVAMVEENLNIARQRMKYPLNVPADARADPALNNYQWTYWTDLINENRSHFEGVKNIIKNVCNVTHVC